GGSRNGFAQCLRSCIDLSVCVNDAGVFGAHHAVDPAPEVPHDVSAVIQVRLHEPVVEISLGAPRPLHELQRHAGHRASPSLLQPGALVLVRLGQRTGQAGN
ncbi:hypothetical protein LTR94_029861, partial [Friedmanniomyces endolithicus]